MATPLWCLFAVTLIPVVLALLGGYYRAQAFGKPDNKNPRAEVARLEGTGARVYAAQANAWEATTLFTAAVITSHLAGVTAASATPWAVAFVVFRVLHAGFYIGDLDSARSGAFLGALVCVIALFVLAATA